MTALPLKVSSVDPADALQFSDEITTSPMVSTPLRSDLPRPSRLSEAMVSPVVSTTASPVISIPLRSDLPRPSRRSAVIRMVFHVHLDCVTEQG